MGAPAQRAQVGQHVRLPQRTVADRDRHVAPLGQGRRRVDEDAGPAEAGVVGLAHPHRESPDEVEVLPRCEPPAADQRRARQRGAGDDVGVAHGGFEIRHRLGRQPLGAQGCGEALGPGGAVVPHGDAGRRTHGRVGAREGGRQRAGTHQQEPRRVGAGQDVGGEGRDGGGAAVREARAVHDGERRPGLARLQHVDTHHGRQPEGAIVGEHVDDLGADIGAGTGRAGAPGRHEQVGGARAARGADGVVMAGRGDEAGVAGRERAAKGLDQRPSGERAVDLVGGDDPHGAASGRRGIRAPAAARTTRRRGGRPRGSGATGCRVRSAGGRSRRRASPASARKPLAATR